MGNKEDFGPKQIKTDLSSENKEVVRINKHTEKLIEKLKNSENQPHKVDP